MEFCVIGSGSSGNMTYIKAGSTKVLVDAGISLPEAKRRTLNHEFELDDITAVLITHEHGDHVRFLSTVLKRTQATLFINRLSFDALPEDVKVRLLDFRIKFIEENKKYQIGNLEFLTLKLSHDSANIFGFVLISQNKRIAYISDTGFFPIHYVDILKQVDAIIIEANHDITMLMESERSWYLKERILSPLGHMSNHICYQILEAVINGRQRVIVLAHISQECNHPDIIENEIIRVLKKTYEGEIVMASQFEASQLYKI
ncbi:MAG: MBL fold metallo-hydrolase [Bacilli bacterium]|nr:MBL fold metallo-hydrolase [Bacilli bacterium]